jgi:hypothetical protein
MAALLDQRLSKLAGVCSSADATRQALTPGRPTKNPTLLAQNRNYYFSCLPFRPHLLHITTVLSHALPKRKYEIGVSRAIPHQSTSPSP